MKRIFIEKDSRRSLTLALDVRETICETRYFPTHREQLPPAQKS